MQNVGRLSAAVHELSTVH